MIIDDRRGTIWVRIWRGRSIGNAMAADRFAAGRDAIVEARGNVLIVRYDPTPQELRREARERPRRKG